MTTPAEHFHAFGYDGAVWYEMTESGPPLSRQNAEVWVDRIVADDAGYTAFWVISFDGDEATCASCLGRTDDAFQENLLTRPPYWSKAERRGVPTSVPAEPS